MSIIANAADFQQRTSAAVSAIEPQVIAWRRHFHEFPELANREKSTAAYISKHMRELGLEVTTGVAHTGVVAVLDSGKPGPTIGLRADMDALPIKEDNDLSFKSVQIGEYMGREVPLMHACGHDTHMAMLMGAASVLSEMKDTLRGKIKFIFQPAEEGPPPGEEGGAKLMVAEGVVENVDVIFGLHINSHTPVGVVAYRSGGILAAVDPFNITIKGQSSHGAYPWLSVDAIATAAQVINGIQTIVSREIKLIDDAAVISIGRIEGGSRSNIIASEVKMIGTIRTLNPKAREHIYEALPRKVNLIAQSMRATADVSIGEDHHYPITYNPPDLMAEMLPALVSAAGRDKVQIRQASTAAEDFSFFQQEVPGLYLFVGGKPLDTPAGESSDHHTAQFFIDESGMKTGVELFVHLVNRYLSL